MSFPVLAGPQGNVQVSTDSCPRFDGTVAVDPNDTDSIFGLCRRFEQPPVYQDQLEVQHSKDGGATWQATLLKNAQGSYSTSDPEIALGPQVAAFDTTLFNPERSNVYAIALRVDKAPGDGPGSFLGTGVLFYSSTDQGLSWSDPTLLAEVSGSRLVEGPFDETRIAVDWSTGGDSSYRGRIYAFWVQLVDNEWFPAFASSDDHGATWERSSSATQGFVWQVAGIGNWHRPRIAVGPDGDVHVVALSEREALGTPTRLIYGRSTDGGETFRWAVLTDVSEFDISTIPFTQDDLSFAIVAPLAFAVGPGGRLAVAWTADRRTVEGQKDPPARVAVAQCLDNGSQWLAGDGPTGAARSFGLLPLVQPAQSGSEGFTLPHVGTDYYFLPQLAFDADGDLGCFAYHYGAAVEPPMNGYLWVNISEALGFELAAPVTTRAFDPTKAVQIHRWNVAEGLYYGDFIGLAATDRCFLPCWSDTRNDAPQLYFSRLCITDG